MTDAELIAQVRAGERDAFARLVDRYQPMVRGVVASRVFDTAAVDDVVQEAFVAAYTNLRKLRDAERFGPWLARIARNAATTHLRSGARRWAAHQRHAEQPQDAAHQPDPGRRELHAWLRDAIGALPEKTREAMMLCYVEGLRGVDAAHFLGIREAALKKRLQHGRALVSEKFWSELKDIVPEPVRDPTRTRAIMSAIPAIPAWQLAAGGGVAALSATKAAVVGVVVVAAGAATVVGGSHFIQPQAPPAAPDAGPPVDPPREPLREAGAGPVGLEIVVDYVSPGGRRTRAAGAEVCVAPLVLDRADFDRFYQAGCFPDAQADPLRGLIAQVTRGVPEPEALRAVGLTTSDLERLRGTIGEVTGIFGRGLREMLRPAPEERWRLAATDAGGELRLDGLPPGLYTAAARRPADGAPAWDALFALPAAHGDAALPRGAEGARVELAVHDDLPVNRPAGRTLTEALAAEDEQEGPVLRVNVRDGETGEPVDGTVTLSAGDWRTSTGGRLRDDGEVDFTLTDVDAPAGDITVAYEPRPGEARYLISDPMGVHWDGQNAPPPVTFLLQRRPTISGHVYFADGTPVAEAHIMVAQGGGGAHGEKRTDASGFYELPHAGGEVTFYASKDMARSEKVTLALGAGQSVVQDLYLEPAATLTLELYQANGQPLVKAENMGIGVETAGLRFKASFTYETDSTYENDGANALSYFVPEGECSVTVTVRGYEPVERGPFLLEAGDAYVERIRLAELPVHALEVRVLDEGGEPVGEGAGFRLADSERVQSRHASSDEDGVLRFESLTAGTYDLIDARTRDESTLATIEIPRDETVTVRLPEPEPRARLRVTVERETADGVQLILSRGRLATLSPAGVQGISSGGSGLEDVTPGTCWAMYSTPGRPAALKRVEVPASAVGGDPVEVTLQVPAAGGILYGTAPGGRRILVLPDVVVPDGRRGQFDFAHMLGGSAEADPDGTFRAGPLPEGTYTASAGGETWSAPFEIRAGMETGPLDLRPEAE